MRAVLDRDVIKAVVADSGMTQAELADRMGYEDQSAVSQIMNRKRSSLDKVVAALNVMGYSVVVKRGQEELFEVRTEWEVEKREARRAEKPESAGKRRE